MSRWLSSVNNLLEKLDDKAETVAQDLVDDTGANASHLGVDIDDILTKRGLVVNSNTAGDEENVEQAEDIEAGMKMEAFSQKHENVKSATEFGEISSVGNLNHIPPETAIKSSPVDQPLALGWDKKEIKSVEEAENKDEPAQDAPSRNDESLTSSSGPVQQKNEAAPTTKAEKVKAEEITSFPPRSPTLPSSNRLTKSQRDKELVIEAKEAQKESRTLRRLAVSLNTQLEDAESELQAQRMELERAAVQMEKDRLRNKESKESIKKSHAEEFATLKLQNEQSLQEQQSRFEDQLESYRNKIAVIENQRKQEDGDWSKEMTSVIEREQEVNKCLMSLEDEKLTLLQQISTLQGQQAALGSRLESLTQAADNAMEREREAESRLDSALSQHARQISHRQARESALERTIQEINVALVAKANQGFRQPSSITTTEKAPDVSARIESLQNELETYRDHLAFEREKSEALHQELRDISKESTQEASVVYAKQLHYDRKVAELELTISNLYKEISQHEKSGDKNQNQASSKANDGEMLNQVKVLSEELVRLREKVSNQSSESLALKNRLQTAMNRATKAENDLAVAVAEGNGQFYDSVEKGRGSSGLGRRRKRAPQNGSIRSAMRLNPGQGERTEQIGKAVDVMDSFAVSTGTYLRRNPLARAGFIFYLLLIHLWTFVLLFFHAHYFESDHVMQAPHGPNALIMQSLTQQSADLKQINPETA